MIVFMLCYNIYFLRSSFRRSSESREAKPGYQGSGSHGPFARNVKAGMAPFSQGENGLFRPLDSGLRRAATGILGRSFQTRLYHLRPVGVPSRRIQDFLSVNDNGAHDVATAHTDNGTP